MKKRYISVVLILLIAVGIIANTSFASFTDLEDYDWAREYIEEFQRRGIVSGTSETTFSPGNNVKREEFVKVIVNLFGYEKEGAECEYTDVHKDDWFYPFVASATKAGIINGVGDNQFGSGRDITRQDICTIIYRVLQDKGYQLKKVKTEKMPFEDTTEISSYAYEAMEAMYQAGVINGMDETHLLPKSNATRAQMVKMVYLSDMQKIIGGKENQQPSGEEPIKEQASIKLNKASISLTVGEKETLKATVEPKEVAKEQIEWSSSNTKIAKVKEGEIEAIAKGTATITAKLKKTTLIAKCEVTVTQKDTTSGGTGGSSSGGGRRRRRWWNNTNHSSSYRNHF